MLFTVGLTVVVTAFCMVVGYILAVLINGLHRSRPIVLGILLISYVLPHVVGAVAFSWLFDSNFGGIVNYIMNAITGGAFGEPLWFTSVWPNRLIIALNVIWFMLPFAMLMILAGLQGVSQEALEAAEIDGASTLQRHRHVIIPSIRGVLGFVILIFTMDVVRTFDSLIPLAPQATGRQRVDHVLRLPGGLRRRCAQSRTGQRDQRLDHRADPDPAVPLHSRA